MENAAQIRDFMRSKKKEIIELQTLLTSIPALAPESQGDGELKKCEALTQYLRSLGFSQFERYDAPDSRVSSKIRPNLVVTLNGKHEKNVLWIMSHLDVVPPGDLSKWNTDPWTVVEKEGKIYGRGVEDNQQGLVSSVFAAYYFLANSITPEYTIKLLFAADEEVGSTYGIQYLLKNHTLFTKGDKILIPDGGDSLGQTMEIAEKNLLWLTFRTTGKQTHGSRPDQGANAHLAACDLALRMHNLETIFNAKNPLFDPDHCTIQPTKKEANVPNINTIPGDDVFCMDCRLLPQYTLAMFRLEIARVASEVEKTHGVSISWTEEQTVESLPTAPDAAIVLELTQAIQRVYENLPRAIGIGGGTVGAYLRNSGFDAVVWSRLEETAHQPNEYCVLENLFGDATVMVCLMSGNK